MVGVIKQDEKSPAEMQQVEINFDKIKRQGSYPDDLSSPDNYVGVNGTLYSGGGSSSFESNSPSPQYRSSGRDRGGRSRGFVL